MDHKFKTIGLLMDIMIMTSIIKPICDFVFYNIIIQDKITGLLCIVIRLADRLTCEHKIQFQRHITLLYSFKMYGSQVSTQNTVNDCQ